ncbi:hypothetical protein Rrhod_2173 [Rhodococcus rhodnii LMG 5362]|uniref:Uncharacterized protein n=1 Tax=Rhodococcus rhodnii LMG 5362 TaxID=1273125 RepID=R7WM86_9NOCA|nr:hypothetical protein Rrhod_2173 [Rhodococcus rhodnii LMG 5362]
MAVVALVSGCGGSDVVEWETERPVMFEPCDDIPDEAIAELGFDVSTEDRGGWGRSVGVGDVLVDCGDSCDHGLLHRTLRGFASRSNR